MKSINRLFVLPIFIIFATLIACFPGSSALEIEEGEALPDGALFRPFSFASEIEGPGIEVQFPGLSKVTATLRESDDVVGEARGKKVLTLKKLVDHASFDELEPGTYDIQLQQGAAKVIADDIVVVDSPVVVDSLISQLAIDFGALESVRADLRLNDGDPVMYGSGVWSAKKQSGSRTYPVLIGSYDLRLRVGAAQHIVHSIDCTPGTCSVSGITSDLEVDFGGLENVRLDLRVDDGDPVSLGSAVWSKNKQQGVQTYPVLRGSYDVRFRQGAAEHHVHTIDCSSDSCSVSDISRTLTVDYGALENVRMDLRVDDGQVGTVGSSVSSFKKQSGVVTYTVLRTPYDIRLRQGAAEHIVDGVDCTTSGCSVSGISETLTVEYSGLNLVRLDLRVTDGVEGTFGSSVWSKKSQSGVTAYEVLKDEYDLRLRQAAATLVIDDVDCTSGPCGVHGVSSNLTVDLGAQTGVKVQLRNSDGEPGTVGSSVWSRVNQSGSTDHEVLRDIYDIKLVADGEETVLDDVDCMTGNCRISLIDGVATDHSPIELFAEQTVAPPTPTRVPAPETPTATPSPTPSRMFIPTTLTPEEREQVKGDWILRPTNTPVPPTPTPVSPPGQIIDLNIEVGDSQALVTWDEPGFIGGSEIQTYRLIVIPLQRVEIINGSRREFLIEGLENGVAYRVQINAMNADGSGRPILSNEFVPVAAE